MCNIWFFSDSHGQHQKLKVPEGIDIAVFCGDESNYKNPHINVGETNAFFIWYSSLSIPNKIYVPGNHCYHEKTMFLTKNGWKYYDEIDETSELATFSDDGNIFYEKYCTRYSGYTTELIKMECPYSKQIVTTNHNVYLKSKGLIEISRLLNENLRNKDLILHGNDIVTKDYDISDDELRLLNFVISDATLVFRKNPKRIKVVQFKISKTGKINHLIEILNNLDYEYTYREATRSPSNVLQPYYIRIYGDYARKIIEKLNSRKQIPDYFNFLSSRQKKIFLNEYEYTDGYRDRDNNITICTINKSDALNIMSMSITSGFRCKFKLQDPKYSGFASNKLQYITTIYNAKRHKGEFKKFLTKEINFTKSINGNYKVVCFTIPNGKLITMCDGKVAFSGNSIAVELKLITWEQYPDLIWLINKPVTIEGIKFWGSPISPSFNNWAYNVKRHKIHRYWDEIPDDTDVLVTHGPPYYIGDLTHNAYGQLVNQGCKNLFKQITTRIKPKVHACGHFHDGNGILNAGIRQISDIDTIFINASTVNLKYKIVNHGFIYKYLQLTK